MIRRDTPDEAGWRRLDELLARLRPATRPGPPPREPARRPGLPPTAPRPAPVG